MLDQKERLVQEMNLHHPRTKDGEQFPLCADTGRIILNARDSTYEFDTFGLAVSNYFKLLKSFGYFFIVCYCVYGLLLIPIYW